MRSNVDAKIQHAMEDAPWRGCRDNVAPSLFFQMYTFIEEPLEELLIDDIGHRWVRDAHDDIFLEGPL